MSELDDLLVFIEKIAGERNKAQAKAVRLRAALQASEEARAAAEARAQNVDLLNRDLRDAERAAGGDAALGKALREALAAWPGYRFRRYGEGQIEFDPFPNVSTNGQAVGFTERDDITALKAAALAREPGRGGADGR